MAGIFKAYDVRGLYPGQLNEELARRIGMGFGHLVELEGDQGAERPRTVVVSRDMRSHSVPLSAALCDGLTRAGLDVLDIGLATTPMNYFATGRLGAAGGIQVTASHNAAEYNGLKFSLAGAVPVSGDHGIPIIEEHALGEEPEPAGSPGRVEATSIEAAYAEHVLSFLDRSFEAGDAPKLRLAADAANGMGTIYRPLLEALGVELLPLYFELDGTFPNHEANPLLPENLRDLSRLVTGGQADLGVSFDGDGDRAAFVDEHGEPIGSDLITGLDSRQSFAAGAVETIRKRLRGLGKSGACRHVDRVQGAPLAGGQASDKGEVVLVAPLLPAALAPTAHAAVLDRLRRAFYGEDLAAIEKRLELARDEPVVGGVVGDAEGDRLTLHAAEGEVHLLRLYSLQVRHHVGVEAQLQDRRRLRVTGELRVPDLVAPVAKVAGPRHAPQEVGVAEPVAVEEHRLEDDFSAPPHRREGLVAPAGAALLVWQVLVPTDLDDGEPLVSQRLQELLLVLDAPLLDAVEHLVFADGSLQVSPDGRTLKLREVLALQVPDEVRRRIHHPPVDLLHRAMLAGVSEGVHEGHRSESAARAASVPSRNSTT